LGDSITTGYGLNNPENECFTALLGEGYSINNKAVNGNTVTGIANQLKTGAITQQEIAAADAITITIGGNDLLALLYAKAAAYNTGNKNLELALLTSAPALLDKNSPDYLINSPEFTATLSLYQETLTAVTTALRRANPDVKIIVATQYNPYMECKGITLQGVSLEPLYAGVEDGVNSLNAAILTGAETGGYRVADVKTAFDAAHSAGNDLSNANPAMAALDLDFHPTAAGHTILAQTFRAALTTPIDFSNGEYTRAEVVIALWHAVGSPVQKNAKMPFADVPADSEYYNAVLWACENGITTGTLATAFSPNATVTRAQVVTFLCRALSAA
jgi:lysophospholipase L1-like esterase